MSETKTYYIGIDFGFNHPLTKEQEESFFKEVKAIADKYNMEIEMAE